MRPFMAAHLYSLLSCDETCADLCNETRRCVAGTTGDDGSLPKLYQQSQVIGQSSENRP